MKAQYSTSRIEWLKTTHPVVAVNAALHHWVHAVHSALSQGVRAVSDAHRRGFYEIEIGNRWFYIHVAERIGRVFVIAAGHVSDPSPQSEILSAAAVQ
jgi:hypothetical protein